MAVCPKAIDELPCARAVFPIAKELSPVALELIPIAVEKRAVALLFSPKAVLAWLVAVLLRPAAKEKVPTEPLSHCTAEAEPALNEPFPLLKKNLLSSAVPPALSNCWLPKTKLSEPMVTIELTGCTSPLIASRSNGLVPPKGRATVLPPTPLIVRLFPAMERVWEPPKGCQTVPSNHQKPAAPSVWKINKPLAGATIAVFCAEVILGMSMPRCVSVISNLAEACGAFVPIPTFWAATDEHKKVGKRKESMFDFIVIEKKWKIKTKYWKVVLKKNLQR